MTSPPVLVAVEDGVAVVTLNRPECANALDLALVEALDAAVTRVASEAECRVMLLLGAGARFCAGGDIAAMAAAPDRGAFLGGLADAAHDVMRRIDALEVPVVAGVHGAAAGAGLALALAADLVVAGESTRFVSGYTAIGLTPDCGTSWLLPRAVGVGRALELTLTNRPLSADEAREWGIVTRVVPDAEVASQALSVAASLASGPATALGRTRRLLRGSFTRSLSEAMDVESASIARSGDGPEAGALIAAFARPRSPSPDPRPTKENHS
jgi:2-(1,2-epoxy-1,2-dihydrophenyl)acetyl-CoA isomerase